MSNCVAEREVSRAERQLLDPQVGDELRQQPSGPVEADEVVDERSVQGGHPYPQRPQPRRRPLPAGRQFPKPAVRLPPEQISWHATRNVLAKRPGAVRNTPCPPSMS